MRERSEPMSPANVTEPMSPANVTGHPMIVVTARGTLMS
jgi:hypothetical protein